jgi:hypothetical protein
MISTRLTYGLELKRNLASARSAAFCSYTALRQNNCQDSVSAVAYRLMRVAARTEDSEQTAHI